MFIPLALSYSSEIAYPIKTAIPHFVLFIAAVVMFLVEYKLEDASYQIALVIISALLLPFLLGPNEEQSYRPMDKPFDKDIRQKLLDMPSPLPSSSSYVWN